MNVKRILGSLFFGFIIVWMVVTSTVMLSETTGDAVFDARIGLLQSFVVKDFLSIVACVAFAFGSLGSIGGRYLLNHKLMHEKSSLSLLIFAAIFIISASATAGVSNLFDAYVKSLPTAPEHMRSSLGGFMILYLAGSTLTPSIMSLLQKASPEEKSVSQ